MLQTTELHPGANVQLKSFGQTPLAYRRRLIALGLHSGLTAKFIRTAPLGCPLYLQVGVLMLALRKDEAKHLLWEPI
jgi:ferrous iron transport protein A